MSEPLARDVQARALWQRWMMASNGKAVGLEEDAEEIARPDELTLAAYAESRLPEAARAAVEAFLAADPEAAADVALARAVAAADDIPGSGGGDPVAPAFEAVIARAAALVPASGDRILPFRPRRASPPPAAWREAARWTAIAASFALVSWLGITMGSGAYGSLAMLEHHAATGEDLFDPPTGLFAGSDVSGT